MLISLAMTGVGLALGLMLGRVLWVHWRGNTLHRALASQDQSGRQVELEALKSTMLEAINTLKLTDLGLTYRGKAAFYALPWYILIGPSAAGKSTILRQSGLHFPFATQDELEVKGFGGTRHCDWWFSDRAIFLDTAGRYTTEVTDHQEWMRFLSILRKHRGSHPIHGIVIALPITDILTTQSAGLQHHVTVIRERLEEIHRQLGVIVPIFLILTKADYLKGFEAFFSTLGEEEREKAWGVHLVHEAGAPDFQKILKGKLEALYVQLALLRAQALKRPDCALDHFALLDFPEQFQASVPAILRFIQQLLAPQVDQETPQLSGVYLTSAAQGGEGRSIERQEQQDGFVWVENQDSSSIRAQNKAYFIHGFFMKVLIPLRHAVKFTPHRWKAMRRRRKIGGAIVSLVVVMGLLIGGGRLEPVHHRIQGLKAHVLKLI